MGYTASITDITDEDSVNPRTRSRLNAQEVADRVGILRDELASPELQSILLLTDEQRSRFDEWSRKKLVALAESFDVDTTTSQKRMSWGMRIASTLGGVALCTAVVMFFLRYWGYLETWQQVGILVLLPLFALGGAEWMSGRERTGYFTGLLALVAMASFVLDLSTIGSIFNVVSTERALLAWGTMAMLLAYRYGLRFILAIGLALLMSYAAAAYTAQLGYHWMNFGSRPEHFLLLGSIVFAVPQLLPRAADHDFGAVYRLVGALTLLTAVLSLAEWGVSSYLPMREVNISRLYEFAGLLLSVGAIWLGIRRDWTGIVNTGAVYFTIFLFTRLYHWWWEWMPHYLFYAAVGAVGIILVAAFKRLRGGTSLQEGVA